MKIEIVKVDGIKKEVEVDLYLNKDSATILLSYHRGWHSNEEQYQWSVNFDYCSAEFFSSNCLSILKKVVDYFNDNFIFNEGELQYNHTFIGSTIVLPD